jgi:hypothetical protein
MRKFTASLRFALEAVVFTIEGVLFPSRMVR